MRSLLKYLLDMKRLPYVILLLVLTISFFAFNSKIAGSKNPPGKYEEILSLVGQMLTHGHFSPQKIDDNFSKKVFTKYIDDLDVEKNVFLKTDINELTQKYSERIDDEIKGDKVESFITISNIFNERLKQAEAWSNEILAKPFDYTIQESVDLDGTKLDFPANDQERKERWRKKIKYYALERYVDLLDERVANKNKKGYVVKTNEQLEKDARAKTDTLINRLFNRFKVKFTEEENFNTFVNTITTTMDPHTEFFAPSDKRYFDEEMSGSFYGIGAGLQETPDGYIKITSINTGSPSAKSGVVQPGDYITKVAQGDGEGVDLMGYGIRDAVKLIRGKEGTIVTLTLKKPDGSIKIVKLKREKIENDIDTYARSVIVKDTARNTKIGMIYLPEFYASFDDANGRRSYKDVADEITKLKAENVNGIVLDLRNNGGGSLYDVVQMVGLFIDQGPVVQVKDRNNRPQVLPDNDKSVLYTGPLAVMVNEFSASASEIFAAAIQDYGRGVIIGSTSTFGKGTVQRNIGLDAKTGFTLNESDLGTVKLTINKFYRISGGSTQLKGVESDVVLPDQIEDIKLREKDNEDALPYDEIAKVDYKPWKSNYSIKEIQELSNKRLAQDSTFTIIKNNSKWLADENDKSYSLNIDAYRKEKNEIKNKVTQMDAVSKLKNRLNVGVLSSEVNKFANDKGKQERLDTWIKFLRQDIYLNQAVKVVEDMIGLDVLAKNAATNTNVLK